MKGLHGFYHADCLFFPWWARGGIERVHVTDYLTDADQKIPEWLIKITFLVKVETTIRLGVKTKFGIMGFI